MRQNSVREILCNLFSIEVNGKIKCPECPKKVEISEKGKEKREKEIRN